MLAQKKKSPDFSCPEVGISVSGILQCFFNNDLDILRQFARLHQRRMELANTGAN